MRQQTFTFLTSLDESDKRFYDQLCRDYLTYAGNKIPNKELFELTENILSHSFIRLPIILDSRLTLREKEFLYLVGRGKSVKQIGEIMKIKLPTLETYRISVLRKLLCNNLPEAVSIGIKYGINPEHISIQKSIM